MAKKKVKVVNQYWFDREVQLCIMSAMLGCTNMGFTMPTVEAVARLIKANCTSLERATIAFTERYMERDSDIKGFTAESKFIGDDLAKDGEKTRKYWGDCWARYEEALELAKQKVETL